MTRREEPWQAKSIMRIWILILSSLAYLACESSKFSINQRTVNLQVGDLGHLPWEPKASVGVIWTFNQAVFTPLVSFDDNFELEPGIFKSWVWDDQTNSYLITIDTNLKFHNYRKLTPQDVEYSLLLPFFVDDYFTAKDVLSGIKGTEKLRGKKLTSGVCEGIKIISEDKIQLTLKKNNPLFLYSLGGSIPPVAPREKYKTDLISFKDLPLGTGSYYVDSVAPNKKMLILKRINFEKEKKKSNKYPLIVKFFLSGNPRENNVDLGGGVGIGDLDKDSTYTYFRSRATRSIQVMDFNYSHNLGKNKLFREAIRAALNKKNVFSTYGLGHIPTNELVPKGYSGYVGLPNIFAAPKALSIVEAHFSKASSPANPLKGIYHGLPGEKKPRYIQILEKQFSKVGLYISFVGLPDIEFKDQNYVLSTYGNPTSFIDPLVSFSPYLGQGFRKLHGPSSDTKARELYQKAIDSKNRNERGKLIKKLSKHFHREVTVVPYSERKSEFVYSTRIESVAKEEINYAFDFNKVKIVLPNKY